MREGGGNSHIKVTWEKGHLLERTTYQCPLRPLLKGSSNSETTPTVAKQQHCTKTIGHCLATALISTCTTHTEYIVKQGNLIEKLLTEGGIGAYQKPKNRSKFSPKPKNRKKNRSKPEKTPRIVIKTANS